MKKKKLKKLLSKYSDYIYCSPLNSSLCDYVRSLCINRLISFKDYDLFVDFLHLLDNLDFRLFHISKFSNKCILHRCKICLVEEFLNDNKNK